MKPGLLPVVSLLSVLVPAGLLAGPADPSDIDAARAAISRVATTLKGGLQSAMKSGGPTTAVQVCRVIAPEIAGEASRETGLEISRVSSRPRNPDNTPGTIEASVLEDFTRQLQQVQSRQDWSFAEINWSESDGETFTYMQAIGTEPLCLQCHGSQLDAELQQQIDRLYPQDQAVGYQAGQLRGAFVVKGPVGSP